MEPFLKDGSRRFLWFTSENKYEVLDQDAALWCTNKKLSTLVSSNKTKAKKEEVKSKREKVESLPEKCVVVSDLLRSKQLVNLLQKNKARFEELRGDMTAEANGQKREIAEVRLELLRQREKSLIH